jgi:hypothetical protein
MSDNHQRQQQHNDDDNNDGNDRGRCDPRERVRRPCSLDLVEGLTSIAMLPTQHQITATTTMNDDDDDDKDSTTSHAHAPWSGNTFPPALYGVPYKTPKWA